MQALLEQRETLLRQQIDAANARLAEFAEAIREQGTTVVGSRGNIRPHPLLAAERELRREQTRALDELEDVLRRLDSERQLAVAIEMTAWKRRAGAVHE